MPYRRKKLTFAISSSDEFLLLFHYNVSICTASDMTIEVSRPTESTSAELQSDYADKQDDYALNFPVLTVTNRSDDAERMS